MKKCTNCGKEVHEDAVKCKWCKEFIKSSNLKSTNYKTALFLLLIGFVLGYGVSFLTNGNRISASHDIQSSHHNSQPTWYRDNFRNLILGKTRKEVLMLVGRPDSTQDSGGNNQYWYYRGVTVDPITNKKDYQVQVVFEYDMVTGVYF